VNRGLGGLYRIVLVLDRRGGKGEVVDFVDLNEQREGDVVAQEFETRVCVKMFDIALGPAK
jgi:hypothetical protein